MSNSVYKNNNFLLLLAGTFVSLLGTEMQNFALSLYVLNLTGSATKFASVLAITILPRLILGPFAGVIADWFDRKKILVLLDSLSGVVIAFAAFVFFSKGRLDMVEIYIISILLSLISLVFQPTSGTIIPSIVDKDKLVDANSVISVVTTSGYLLAPIIAGILMGITGLFYILVINSISFFLSATSEMFIAIPKIKKASQAKSVKLFISDFKAGLSFLIGSKIVLGITFICMALNFSFNPLFSIGVPYILKKVIHVSDGQFGFFNSVLMCSMFLAPMLSVKLSKMMPFGRLSYVSFSVISAMIIIYAIFPALYQMNAGISEIAVYFMMMLLGFIIALIVSIGNIAIMTILQKEIPLDIMGRVKSANSTLVVAIIPLGQMVFGYYFDHYPAWLGVLICGIIMLATVLLYKNTLLGIDEPKSAGLLENIE